MLADGHLAKYVMLAVLLSLAVSSSSLAETIRCPDVKDVWISTQPSEQDYSMGQTETLKLKVLQEMALLGFDVSALKGRQIKSAELFLYPVPSGQGSELQ